MPRLMVDSGPDAGRVFDVPHRGTVVGSNPGETGIRLSDDAVPAKAFVIGLTQSRNWALQASGGQVQVNGTSVRNARLAEGDQIALAGTRFTFTMTTADDESWPEIKGFKISRRVGRGSGGTVYRAVQLSLDRAVALKVLSGDGEDAAEAFVREARAAARLHHPHVVAVFDAGRAEGHAYLAMEYMEGGNLEDVVARQGALPEGQVVEIMREISRALLFAEEQGTVHRDVKPANIMLSASGSAKLADLGLAAASGEGGGQGTPHFVAPEQARAEPVDIRGDLYSLGATAWRLLTGETLFQGDSVREILQAQLGQEPPPLRELLPDASPDLERILARLLAKNREDRHAGPEELLADLELLEGTHSAPWRYVAAGLAAAGLAAAVMLTRGDGAGDQEPLVVEIVDEEAVAAAAEAGRAAGDAERRRLESQLAEARADAALAALPFDLPRLERLSALETHAQAHPDTRSAALALAEADALRLQGEEEAAAEDAVRRMRDRALTVIDGATLDHIEAGRPSAAVAGVSTLPSLGSWLADPELGPHLAEVADAISRCAMDLARSAVSGSAEAADAGHFQDAEATLASASDGLVLPPIPVDAAAASWAAGPLKAISEGRRLLSGAESRLSVALARERTASERAARERWIAALQSDTGIQGAARSLDPMVLLESLASLAPSEETSAATETAWDIWGPSATLLETLARRIGEGALDSSFLATPDGRVRGQMVGLDRQRLRIEVKDGTTVGVSLTRLADAKGIQRLLQRRWSFDRSERRGAAGLCLLVGLGAELPAARAGLGAILEGETPRSDPDVRASADSALKAAFEWLDPDDKIGHARVAAERDALLALRETIDACASGRIDLAESPLVRLGSSGTFLAAALSDGSTPLGLEMQR